MIGKKKNHQCQICACTSQLVVCDTIFPLMGNNSSMVFVQWSITHTPVWLSVCLCLCWQSPVSVPHRIRSTSRSTREGKTLSEINCELPSKKKQKTKHPYLYQGKRNCICLGLVTFNCFSFPVFDSWSGEIWSSAQKGDGTPSWTGELSSVTCV